MDFLSADKTGDIVPIVSAFIFYRPKEGGERELLCYSDEAWRVISLSASEGEDPTSHIALLCLKWVESVEKRSVEGDETDKGKKRATDYIDVLQSKRRMYFVRGVLLAGTTSAAVKEKRYLFILERRRAAKINLSAAFRQLNLNPREQQIVQLLMGGSSNKEIADSLSLSLNTIKGYMKLLSRKVGAANRAGIIAAVLSVK